MRTETGLRFWRAIVPALFSADADQMSLLHFLFYIHSGGMVDMLLATAGGAQDSRVVGGSQAIALRAAEELGDAVWLGCPVHQIRQDADGVEVVHEHGSVRAERVIVALPPALAGRIRYSPPLPARRDHLTQQVPMGWVIKIQTRYDEPFWREDGLSGFVVGLDDPVSIMFDNCPEDLHSGVLLGFLEGEHGTAASLMDADERREMVLRCFAKYFGERALQSRRVHRAGLGRGGVLARLLRRPHGHRRVDALRADAAHARGPHPLGRHRDIRRVERLHGRCGPLRRARVRGSARRAGRDGGGGVTMALDIDTTGAIETLDRAVGELREGERAWARTPLAARRELLLELGEAASREAGRWVEEACRVKGLEASSPLVGEEWITGPWALLSSVGALAGTLDALASGTSPAAGYKTGTAPGGRTTVEVLPHNVFDRLLLTGYSASVWMQPGISREQVRETAGLGQRAPEDTRGVALVLGAGNITSIAPLDVLYQLYAENRVALLKLNPVLESLHPVLERIFAPFVQRGLVRIVTGGAAEGAYLAQHPGVAAVHITGSAATHDAIVFGTPRLEKPITSELGGTSPVIVLPGRWSDGDLRFQAEHVATMKLHNAGHNCVAAQVVLLPAAWPQKQRFLDHLQRALAAAPARPTWYDGASARVDEAAGRPGATRTGDRVLVSGLDIDDPSETALRDEWFAPVLGVAELPGDDPAAFLRTAVDAANERLHGTLGANVIAHPRSIRALGGSFEDAIAELRYGTVAVNAWTGLGYLTPRATWGAFPGHPLADIQSGQGVVHNALLLADTERTVVRGPFRPLVKPPWFATNRTAAVTGRRLTGFAARPRWSALPAIFASALRG